MRRLLLPLLALVFAATLAAQPPVQPKPLPGVAPAPAPKVLLKADGTPVALVPAVKADPAPAPKEAGPKRMTSDGETGGAVGIDAKTGQAFPRGGRRSPAHRIAAAPKFQAAATLPPQFAMLPSAIHMWGNDQYGDCVSAQEACSLASWTTYCGSPVVPTDAECIAFARKHGLLNGADLVQVMDIMAAQGMTVGGKVYKDGGHKTVDYSASSVLQSALTVGPVNVAIDANALPSGAGNKMGWFAFGGRPGQYPNTDHCITFLGYGQTSFCYQAIHVPLPAGVDGQKMVYICDTWNTLGIVDQEWVMSTMTEAWVRNPTTVGFAPAPPAPAPIVSLTATPTSGAAPLFVAFTVKNEGGGIITSQSIDFGDGQTSVFIPATHSYEKAGSYTAVLTATGPGGTASAKATVSVGVVPPPPPPGPTPGSGDFTLTTTTVQVYKGGKPAGPSVTTTTVSGTTGGAEGQLQAAGINPFVLLADIAQLRADIKAKAGPEAIFKDVVKIMKDLGVSPFPFFAEPAEPKSKSQAPEPAPCCGREYASKP